MELCDLLEMVAELNDGRGEEHASGVHDEPTVLEEVEIRGDEKKVGARLDGQETTSGYVDTVSVSDANEKSEQGEGPERKDGRT